MATSATPAPAQPTLEQKILQASSEAAVIASAFSPAVATAIQTGVAVEPVISGLVHMFAELFRHHAKQAQPAPAPAK